MILGHSDLPLPVKIPRGFFEPPDYPHAGMSAAIFFPPRAHYPQWLAIPIRRALAQRGERLNSDCCGGYDLREEFYGEWRCMDCGAKSPADCIYSK